MKKFLIFQKTPEGYGIKLGSYEAEFKDDTSTNRSYLHAEPLASHFECPQGVDEDCVKLVWVEAVAGVEAQPEKWTKEGEEDVFSKPMIDVEGELIEDDSWTFVPAVEAVEAVPAHYEVQEDPDLVAAKVEAATIAHVQQALHLAKAFGEQLMNEFTTQNIMLGITQAGMTGTVRKHMAEVILALQTGSLYDAIEEAKAIPGIHKDEIFITDERLLSFVNKIEEFLGLELSQEL